MFKVYIPGYQRGIHAPQGWGLIFKGDNLRKENVGGKINNKVSVHCTNLLSVVLLRLVMIFFFTHY